MRRPAVVAAAVVAVIAAAMLWWWARVDAQRASVVRPSEARLLGFPGEDVIAVRVRDPRGPSWSARRAADETWRFDDDLAPLEVDRAAMRRWLDRLRAMAAGRTVAPDGSDPMAFGLDPGEALSLEVKRRDGRVAAWDFGRHAPTVAGCYARPGDGAPVVLVDPAARDIVAAGLERVTRTRVLDDDTLAGAVEVVLERPDAPVVRLAGRAGSWSMVAPVSDRADDGSVDSVLRVLGSLRVDRAIPDARGPDPVEGRVTVRTGDGRARTVLIGARDSRGRVRVARAGAGWSGEVAAGSVSGIARSPWELRDRRIVAWSPADVARVRFEADAAARTLARDGSRRLAREVEDWIARLCAMRAVGEVEREASEDPLARLVLEANDGHSLTVRVQRHPEEGVDAVRVSDREAFLFLVEREAWRPPATWWAGSGR